MAKMPKFDRPALDAIDFPETASNFRDAQLDGSLVQIFNFALQESRRGIDYYERQAMRQGQIARLIRGGSLVLFVAGTLAPIVTTLIYRAHTAYDPNWAGVAKLPLAEIGYTLLAIAGGLVIFDQFFGHSGSWMRFRQTQARLEVMEAQFRCQWASRLAAARGDLSGPSVVTDLMALATAHVTSVAALYEAETKQWAEQFRAQLASFDQRLEAAQEAARQQVAQDAKEGDRAGAGKTDGRSGNGEAPLAAQNVDLRLAIADFTQLDAGSLVITLDGAPVAADGDGFAALSVAAGSQHNIVAAAKIGGAAVQGELSITPTLDDDEKALELRLEPVS